VQASMGALAHVQVHYTNLINYFESCKQVPIYGAFLEGEIIYDKTLTNNGIIVMGNEGNGIRPEIEEMITQKLFIPPFPINAETTESLNVAAATAVICSEFRRL
jgi:TrmH family RNA methyltransferase